MYLQTKYNAKNDIELLNKNVTLSEQLKQILKNYDNQKYKLF